MPRRQCLECGRVFLAGRRRTSRCAGCQPHPTTPRSHQGPWRRIARLAVADWVRANGYRCPGWGRDPHQADPDDNPLTADHRVPASKGGTAADGVDVLCRECNSRKNNKEGT